MVNQHLRSYFSAISSPSHLRLIVASEPTHKRNVPALSMSPARLTQIECAIVSANDINIMTTSMKH